MLAFPMFGPFLGLTLGPDIGLGGLVFIVGSLCGYLSVGFTTWRPRSLKLRLTLAVFLTLGTLLTLAVPMPLIVFLFVLFGLSLALTPLVIEWLHWLATSSTPHTELSVAMISSNIILVLAILTFTLSPIVVVILFDILCYILALAALAWWVQHKRVLSPIAALTLSALGLGLLFAQTTSHSIARILLSIGLAGADFYLWMTLWVLAKSLPVQKTFAFGLGLSLIPIALATGFDMYGALKGYSRQTFFAVALGVTMILLPLIFSSKLDIEKSEPQTRFTVPTNLTETESKVFALLAQGVSDQQISEELFISRHTVKFHVRNILHKCDVPNRKVLLSRLTTEKENS